MTPEQRRIEAFLGAFNLLARASDRITTIPLAGAVLIVASPYTYEVRFAVEGLPMRCTFVRTLIDDDPAALAARIFGQAARAHNPTASYVADCTLAPMGAAPWVWQVAP
jgi:hypothetical protein